MSTAPAPRPRAAIFDVDGTLCDVSSIRYHLDPTDARSTGRKDFDAFHAASIDCPPHPFVVDLAREHREAGDAVLVVTARRARWSFHTLLWLREQGVDHDGLYMRADDDHRPDVDVKADILTAIRRTYDVTLAVDDSPHVVALWEREGIPTVVVPGWSTRSA